MNPRAFKIQNQAQTNRNCDHTILLPMLRSNARRYALSPAAEPAAMGGFPLLLLLLLWLLQLPLMLPLSLLRKFFKTAPLWVPVPADTCTSQQATVCT